MRDGPGIALGGQIEEAFRVNVGLASQEGHGGSQQVAPQRFIPRRGRLDVRWRRCDAYGSSASSASGEHSNP
jgi:hypothetical protein